ncbi:hypothetical protein [Dongia sp.]|uniref:hypothetical protein n=1 Tax=Dongia sp. TaxID=1977262 RepID=UPI0037515D93
MVLRGPPDSAGRGKFDHDLKARAGLRRPAKTATRQADRSLPGGRDSMTRPEDDVPGAAPAAVPTDAAPEDPTPEILQREPLHFIVILLLLADIVFGLGLAVFAEKVLAFRPMAIMGCGLAALGLGVLGYFVLFGGGKRTRW